MKDAPFNLASATYTPGRLLDEVAFVLRADSGAALALLLEVDPAQISRTLNRKAPASDALLVRIMDRTGWRLEYLRELMGVPYDGIVYPPRVRRVEPVTTPRDYHQARRDILQAMPGTIAQLVKKSGYARGTVEIWVRKMRIGDPLARASHIIGWTPPASSHGSGPHAPIHQAGAGHDAPRVVLPKPSRRRYG